jgi:rSAM/selenodomain-associated transferase 2
MRPELSAIVPALEEERNVGACVGRLLAAGCDEVIVADGGSRDRTIERARAAGARVVEARRGRAVQLNAGAKEAGGAILLFCHADVRVPVDAGRLVREAMGDPRVVGGAFQTWTVNDPAHCSLGPLIHLADVRSRYTRVPYGDQCPFVRAEVFDRIGGFPEIELMEDVAFSQRLRREGRLVRLKASVEVSGRRFQAQPLRMTAIVNVFPLLFRLGVSPRTLERIYGHVR